MASPVTPASIQATIPSSTGTICAKLKSLWSLANRMYEWFAWAFTDGGEFSDEFKASLADVSVAIGSITFWPLSTSIPDGYLVANGQSVSRASYPALFSRYGTQFGSGDGTTTFGLPDYRGVFLMGASAARPVGNTGGAETVTLLETNLPEHEHEMFVDVNRGSFDALAADTHMARALTAGSDLDYHISSVASGDTTEPDVGLSGSTGGNVPVTILPPYAAGYWLIKT